MELIVELWAVLALVPSLVIKLTNDVKWFVPKWIIFWLPYAIGVLVMVWLWAVFNWESIGIYILNGVLIWFAAQTWYEFSKKKNVQRDDRVLDQFNMLQDAQDLLSNQ